MRNGTYKPNHNQCCGHIGTPCYNMVNMVTWHNVLKSLETLHIWWNMSPFMKKKIILSQSNSFLQVFKISPMVSCANPWFGIWGNLGWNMVTWQNVLKSLETLHKWSSMSSFLKKSFWASQTHFCKFSKFHLCSPVPIHDLVCGVKYGNLT